MKYLHHLYRSANISGFISFKMSKSFTNYITFWNGYKMPIVGLGTWQSTEEEIETAVSVALEAGYRHIDTAYMYCNEVAIGKVLKKWFDSGKLKREDLFITSKLPCVGMQPGKVQKYLDLSLSALQVSYLDLYLIHIPCGIQEHGDELFPTREDGSVLLDMTTDHVQIWKVMEDLVDSGKIRSIGLSNFNSEQIKRIVKSARIKPANLQVELNVYFQQRELTAFCKALDITVCAYAPIGSPGYATFMTKSTGESYSVPWKHLCDPIVTNIANKHGKTPAQVLLRYLMQRKIAVIPKSINPTRIRQNFEVFDIVLNDDETEELDSLDKGSKARIFTMQAHKGMTEHPEYPFYEKY